MNIKNGADHMANERTFLAWIRTSIIIIALGFVVEKFALFVKKMALFTPNTNLNAAVTQTTDSNAVSGVILILLGAVIAIMAYVKFKMTARQINNEDYKPFYLYDLLLTITIVATGIVLAFFIYPM